MAADPTHLFEEWRRTGRRSIRNELVEMHMGLAVHIARRFDRAGRANDDLEQAALLALIKAVDRYEPARGVPFAAFAARTIEGEIKRYFRDKTWTVQVPRSAKELYLAVRGAAERLTAQLGRSPTVAELADHLGIAQDQVLIGLTSAEARTVGSIDARLDDGSPLATRLADTAGAGYDAVEDQDAVGGLLATLPERERTIVVLRFYDGLSQSEIAARVGVSQMHVSRLLRSSLARLRERAEQQQVDEPGDTGT